MENQQNHDTQDTLAKILDTLTKFQFNQEIANEEFKLRLDALETRGSEVRLARDNRRNGGCMVEVTILRELITEMSRILRMRIHTMISHERSK